MSLVWGFHWVLLLGGGGFDPEELRYERFSFFGPTWGVDPLPLPEPPDVLPPWMNEGDEESAFPTPGPPDLYSPLAARSRVGSLLPCSESEAPTQASPAGPEKSPPQNPPREAEPFDPPHASWTGVGKHFSSTAWKEDVWNDYLATPEILLPLGFAVAAAAISHWDKTLERHWQGLLGNHRSYSDIGQDALIGLVVLDGVLLPGEGRNWWDEAWTIGEAYAASSLTVYVLKTTVQRGRPSSGGSGLGTHSFPSGHSSSAFTAAALIERNSGPLFGVPSYGLAAFTAFQRVEEGHHYPSDILAGAAIGIFSSSVFDSLHWGAGPGDGGIARPPPEAKLGFQDGLHGFSLELSFRF